MYQMEIVMLFCLQRFPPCAFQILTRKSFDLLDNTFILLAFSKSRHPAVWCVLTMSYFVFVL